MLEISRKDPLSARIIVAHSQRAITPTEISEKTSKLSTSEDVIARNADEKVSLIRRPMYYDPVSRPALAVAIYTVPPFLQVSKSQFIENMQREFSSLEVLSACLDGSRPLARMRISHLHEIEGFVHYDPRGGVVQMRFCPTIDRCDLAEPAIGLALAPVNLDNIFRNVAFSLAYSIRNQRGVKRSDASQKTLQFYRIDPELEKYRPDSLPPLKVTPWSRVTSEKHRPLLS